MRRKEYWQLRCYQYKRSHLGFAAAEISVNELPSTWWPAER
jgi:hypothetical protein